MTPLVAALALAWGAVAGAAVGRVAARAEPRARARGLARGRRPRRVRRPPLPAPCARVVGAWRARRQARRAAAALAREAPVAIDLLAVASGAGCTPYDAIELAAAWAPPRVAAHLSAVPDACRLGDTLAAALARLGRDAPALRPCTDALLDTVRLGAPAGPALARAAAEARANLRRAAETRARRVPVRLLFPLVFGVLPAFGLLTVVPALLAGFGRA